MPHPLLLVLALSLPSLWPLAPAHRAPPAPRLAWKLHVRADRFTGHIACRLSRGGVIYERRAIVIRLPPEVDTSNAAYRIDWGRVYWARDDAAELAGLGFALNDGGLDNPSGGLVRIPARLVIGAKLVSVEARANTSPFRFKVEGLGPALDAARRARCDDDIAFPAA